MHCNFLINIGSATAHDLELPRRNGPLARAGNQRRARSSGRSSGSAAFAEKAAAVEAFLGTEA